MAQPQARTKSASARRTRPRAKRKQEAGSTPTPVCSVAICPICTAIGAAQEFRPDVVQHLLAAGREMLLAARAFVDARVEEAERSARLEKIDIG